MNKGLRLHLSGKRPDAAVGFQTCPDEQGIKTRGIDGGPGGTGFWFQTCPDEQGIKTIVDRPGRAHAPPGSKRALMNKGLRRGLSQFHRSFARFVPNVP